MTAQLTSIPQTFAFDPSGALWFERDRVLVVSDLHLEKGSAFARRGMMVPPYDTRETLRRLAALLRRYRPAGVIALGDTLHDQRGMDRIGAADAETFRTLRTGMDWIWITGNHDPVVPASLGGTVADTIRLGDIVLRHEPSVIPQGFEIAGHLHPAGRIRLRGKAVRRRCFVIDAQRCVMPAFGAYAGGLNVLDRAFQPLFPSSYQAHFLGENRIYRIDPNQLCAD
jgi:DNA ligase-associated metallophosphoesterase